MTASRPVSSASRSPTEGAGAASSFSSSAPIRSPDRCATSPALAADRGERRGLDREVERRRQPHGPDHPQGVLAKPRVRVAHRPQDARGPGPPARRTGRRGRGQAAAGVAAPGDRVDREVAAGEIRADVVAELDAVRPPEVRVLVLGAEGRDLVARRRRAGWPPCRTGSRRRRRGTARPAAPAARPWRGPSRRRPGPAARRAASRPRRRRRARPRGGVSDVDAPARGRPRASRASAAVSGAATAPPSSGRGRGSCARPRCGRPRGTA